MRNRQLEGVAGAIALASFALVTGCDPASGPADAIFEHVGASDRWDNLGQITRQFANPLTVPRYLIIQGRVYLLTQVTQPHLLAIVVYEQPTWRVTELASLIQQHPELKRYDTNLRWAGER